MKGTVAVTDFGWYDYLSRRSVAEVNFWTPSDRRRFSAPAFSPFFFKLKAPHRAIAGFGYFAKWSSLPPWLAWECCGEGNGCDSLATFETRLADIRARIKYVASGTVANIGCILLVQPIFFPREAWIPQPSDWHDRTVSSESYDLTVGEGRRIWEQCLERAHVAAIAPSHLLEVAGSASPRYGAPQLVAPRLGQGTFRVSVTDAYGRSCAATGEHSLPVLEAAHIRSYASEGPHEVRNGILLRADLHRLFDKGYATVTRDLRLEISKRLREDYSNGRSYYPLHGQPVRVPDAIGDRPASEFLVWHNEHVYLG
ncbi:MAG TPA: HNH endonuclease [Thermoanaerobaculia bacterium]|nr:HNH endonuclease [Thermoanaerobaculia bacterium]